MTTTLTRLRRAAWIQALAIAALIPGLVFLPGTARSNPTGGVVTHGAAEIGDGLNGHLMINQLSNRAVINWESFNISAGEMTQFVQPGQSAMMLSKVMSGAPSSIYGTLQANGGHILVNPNGILVGPGGRIDVGGLNVVSTLDIDSNQFMRGGPLRFTGNTSAGVTNFGTITSAGGDVILLGNFVDNQGKLGAVNGTVALGAGGEILLEANGESTISILRGGAGGGTGVNNSGTITGAAVEMKAHGNVYALAVNNSGAIRATGGGRKGGRVILSAPGGTIENTGSIIAKKANGAGGEILIDATGGTANIEAGEVRADGSGGRPGGTVTVLADTITVGAPATVSANGGDGGTVTLGSVDGTSSITVDGNVEAIGRTGVGGTINLYGTADSVISVNGNLTASGATRGGVINARGGQFNQGPNSIIDAGGGATGGTVNINARGVNTLGGIIEATGDTAEGGEVQVTGDEVNLKTGAVIDTSAALGSGEIYVGGGFQGRDESIPNATSTVVEEGVRLAADALMGGTAGTVVVWADGDTFFAGDISARARGEVGNGGLIEVSGRQQLTVRGGVDASSINGHSGGVLFDPGDVVVGNADDAAVDIDSETVNLTLQTGTSVIIATESGDITFLNTGVDNEWHDSIQWTNSNASFGAFASGSLFIETHIRTSGAGSINLLAGWTGSESDLAGFGFTAGAVPGTFEIFESVLGIPTVESAWQFFVETGQFGDRSNVGNIFMGGADTTRHVVVGSRFGNTNVAAGDLFMIAPQRPGFTGPNPAEDNYIHLGFRDTGVVFGPAASHGFANAFLELNDRALETNNNPIVGINHQDYYRDINNDGIADGVFAINSSGVLDFDNYFNLKQYDRNDNDITDIIGITSSSLVPFITDIPATLPTGVVSIDVDMDGIPEVRENDVALVENGGGVRFDWNQSGTIDGATINETGLYLDVNNDGDFTDFLDETIIGADINGDGDMDDTAVAEAGQIAVDLNNDGDFADSFAENTVGVDLNRDLKVDGETVTFERNLRLIRGFNAGEARNMDVNGDSFVDEIAQISIFDNTIAGRNGANGILLNQGSQAQANGVPNISLFDTNGNNIADQPDPTLIPFASHFQHREFGNYWWQQIDAGTNDPLGGLPPEHGAGRDPNVTTDPTSRADINVALTGGLLQQSGGRHQDYVQIGHGGDATSWDSTRSMTNNGTYNGPLGAQSIKQVVFNGSTHNRVGTGIGRLAGVFGNINVLTGVDPLTVLYNPADPNVNLTGISDNKGGFLRMESWQNVASSNGANTWTSTNPNANPAGNNSESYTQIGHLGTGQHGRVEGDINVQVGGNLDLLAGAHTRSHSTIGHTMNGFTYWNPGSNEHQQIRFFANTGDFDNPNLRRGELFQNPTETGDARGFYEAGNDGGQHDNDFWTAPGTPGVTGTLVDHPDQVGGPVHVPALVGGVDKTIVGNIKVDVYGDKGVTIRAYSNPDTRTQTGDYTLDDPVAGTVEIGDLDGDGVGDSRNERDLDDIDGLRRLTDRKFAGIGHGGAGFALGNDRGGEELQLRIVAGDVETEGTNPGETEANLQTESRTIRALGGTNRNRAPTFVNLIGNIEVNAHNGGVLLSAGNDTYDYAYIGHGGNDFSDYETSNVVVGDVSVTAAKDLDMLGSGVVAAFTGQDQRSARSHVQIGHHTTDDLGIQYYGGNIDVNIGGNITMIGARLGMSHVKIGHQGGFEGWGQSGGTFGRQEHFLYGPQITDVDPDSATGRTMAVTFAGAEVTDSNVTITFGDHNATRSYAINTNTANITVNAGSAGGGAGTGNIVMTHPDPQLIVTQNMHVRDGGGAMEMRWSPVAIGHGGRSSDALRSNNDNALYFYADKTGDIDVTAGSLEILKDNSGAPILDGNGDPQLILDVNGDPIVSQNSGNITMQNGTGEERHTNIGHYFEDTANANNGVNNFANAYKIAGDINVTAYGDLTLDHSFTSANDPVNIVNEVGAPVSLNNFVRIGHGASDNAVDVNVLDGGEDINGILASSDINIMVGNDLNMGWLRENDGSYEAFKTGLEDHVQSVIGVYSPGVGNDPGVSNPINFFRTDDDPNAGEDVETHGARLGSFSQIGHGYTSTNGGQAARPDGYNGDITVDVGNDLNVIAGREAWILTVPSQTTPDFQAVIGSASVIGHGGSQAETDLSGDIGVYVGNDLSVTGSNREQTSLADFNKDPLASIGNLAKIGHWSIDLDVAFGPVFGDHEGDIDVVVGRDLTLTGGQIFDYDLDTDIDGDDFLAVPTQFAFAQIGHSGPGVKGEKSGDIEVLVQNNLTTIDGISELNTVVGPANPNFTAPVNPGDPNGLEEISATEIRNANAYVMIGNGDWSRDGAGFSGDGGTGPGARRGDIFVLVGNSAELDHTLVGHADPSVSTNDATILLGNTYIGVSRNFPFFDSPAGTPEGAGNLTTTGGTVFSSAFYGLGSELRIYVPQRENNLMGIDDPTTAGFNEGTRLNSSVIGYIGTPQAGGVNGVGGTSFVNHAGGVFDSSLEDRSGRDDEVYLQPDLWWDDAVEDTFGGTTGIFPADLIEVEGGMVSNVAAPGGAPSITTLTAGVLGDGTELDGVGADDYIEEHTQGGIYTIYYDAIEPVGTTVAPPVVPEVVEPPVVLPPTAPNPPRVPNTVEPIFFLETAPLFEEVALIAPALDLVALLGLVDAQKYDTWDRYYEGAYGAGPDAEGFYENIGLFGIIYGPGGLLSEEENIEVTTGNTLLDSLGVLVGFETIGVGQDELEEQEKRAVRYRTLGKTYLIQYRQLLNTGQLNRYNSANVFSGNGLPTLRQNLPTSLR